MFKTDNIKLTQLLAEIVPFDKYQTVKQGLERSEDTYKELAAYTFGIELEYHVSDEERDVDMDRVREELEHNRDVRNEYDDWLNEQRSRYNLRTRSADNWDDSYGPIDMDTYDNLVSEPSREDFDDDDDYNEAMSEYNEKRYAAEVAYSRFEGYRYLDYLDEFIESIIDHGRWEAYIDPADVLVSNGASVENSIETDLVFLDSIGEKAGRGDASRHTWGVGEDQDGVVEIRSKYLTQNDFDLVKQVCEHVAQQHVAGDTSAHVHVGVPDDFDAFDILAITTLVDEDSIQRDVGAGRELATWAKLRQALHNSLVGILLNPHYNTDLTTGTTSFVISNEKLLKLIGKLSKYTGTNPTPATYMGTIEFRYFGSTITKNPDLFIKWIQYYLLLPRVAKSRNRIVIKDKSQSTPMSIIAIRQPGSVKFVMDKKSSAPSYPAKDIKQGQVPGPSKSIAKLKKDKQDAERAVAASIQI